MGNTAGVNGVKKELAEPYADRTISSFGDGMIRQLAESRLLFGTNLKVYSCWCTADHVRRKSRGARESLLIGKPSRGEKTVFFGLEYCPHILVHKTSSPVSYGSLINF